MIVISYTFLCIISFLLNRINASHKAYYSIETPYKPPPSSLVLPRPPAGFELVCAQMVARHGCRTLKYKDYDGLSLALWTQANKEDALTQFGEQLGEDLQHFTAVNDGLGRGALSGSGKLEHQSLAHRLANRLSPLFKRIPLGKPSSRIKIISSGESRATQSLNEFVKGLPSGIASLLDYEPPNSTLLDFHTESGYQEYLATNEELNNKIQSIRTQPNSAQMIQKVLARLYKQSFIDRLADGYYTFTDDDSGKTLKNEVDAINMLHGLYLVASNLHNEGVGSLFEKYFHPRDSAWFAYLHDAYHYYTRGPSFSNRTITFDIAQILLDDFLVDSEKCSQPDATHFLRARFGHGGTISPFEALLKIPIISDKQTPVDETYTYENNGWRGELLSPLAANIQWEIYRHRNYGRTRHAPHQQILVRMLLNEYPVPFKYECKPYKTIHDFFYTLDELKRCYDIASL